MFKSILVPVDVSVPDDTQRLLKQAGALADQWGSDLHVVTVVPNVGMAIVGTQLDQNFEETSRMRASDELSAMLSQAAVSATPHTLMGTVYDRVIVLAEELDVALIVLGAHRPELRDYLLGSNAARLVRHSNRSVLVLRD
jgi:universal stress protein F